MIENIIEWSIRNRVIVLLIALAVGVAGARALLTMPVDAIPDLSESQIIVFTDWMGRSPQEIEDQVTYPLSVKLQGLAGVKVVRSSSEFNFSMINIIFDDATDYYFARQRVQEKLSIASTFLPSGVTPYMAPDATALGQIFWYTVEGDHHDLGKLRSIQDWYIRYQLNSVPGVAEVASVGGAPREYQIDIDAERLRSYGLSLGDVYSAVARANSAVGGGVVQKGGAEYVIRSVGWIKGLDDLRTTVVAERDGTPIDLQTLATVQIGPAVRRSVLEKDGNEAVGGVVLMRHGENPLEVTRRVKEKINAIQAGLPDGVRIVSFYDRSPLIRKALLTVGDTVRDELIVCSVAILLVMGHLGGAFVVSVTLPLAVLFSFLMMKLCGIPSNIMSLAGIAISVGILEDQAVVMTENAAHHLTRRFGNQPVRGNTLDIIIPACRTVGRPIFFSVLITILSFLPVFALSGMEGKMFHPLAYTKTFALVGVAILAITAVPALIPIFLRGRIKSEEDSWLVRTMTNVFRPMLEGMMSRPTLVCWLFVCILGAGYLASTRLGREFMPPLDEGMILDMPTSVPRVSVTEAIEDLKKRDAIIRGFPEILTVVGKAGRAETATDPAPLEMVETIINLQDRSLWPKRKLLYKDAIAHARAALDALVSRGIIKAPDASETHDDVVNNVAMRVVLRVDAALREVAKRKIDDMRPALGRALVAQTMDQVLGHVADDAKRRAPTTAERSAVIDELTKIYGDRIALEPRLEDVTPLVEALTKKLTGLGVIVSRAGVLTPPPRPLEQFENAVSEFLGRSPETFDSNVCSRLTELRQERMARRLEGIDGELFDRAVVVASATAIDELSTTAVPENQRIKSLTDADRASVHGSLVRRLRDNLLLWKKSKNDLIQELDTVVQIPGWGNIWTQPIVNRIDMLATGVRTQIGVKIFGDRLDVIQRVGEDVAEVLRSVPGAVDVVADQIVGKGYIEIQIDRKRAARYGIQVGDIQDVVEVAMGGKPLAMTVEGRERYPVRVRYSRDYRTDEESLKNILVTTGARRAEASGSMGDSRMKRSTTAPLQVPLSEVAEVRVVEGPSVIKSENGLLRSYVQLNVRNRDTVGFVEEAKRIVAERVELPAGTYLEWSGQFENQVRARKTLLFVVPAVVGVILLVLYMTYRSWMDALLMLMSVLGALAGGAIFQWVFGYPFSVAVWVGYIACFGMAVETSVVMLVYLREAIADRGGLEGIQSVEELRQAIVDGAVHRLRPKLLTEGTTIISIAPMLWATGVGAEVIRPMAAPVLGGLLIADEVIDLFLPVVYFAVKKWQWRRLHGVSAFEEASG
jgi:Cu(I)/Ag(I) efflux system membrane protein CusA/SilA